VSVVVIMKDLPTRINKSFPFMRYGNFRDAFRCVDSNGGHIHFFSSLGEETFVVCFDKECLEE